MRYRSTVAGAVSFKIYGFSVISGRKTDIGIAKICFMAVCGMIWPNGKFDAKDIIMCKNMLYFLGNDLYLT